MYGHNHNDDFTTSAVLSGQSRPDPLTIPATASIARFDGSFQNMGRVAPHFIWSGDFQGIENYRLSERPLLNEESYSSIIEGMNRVCRYSPEEKKQRIQRYRNKRNQRNFNKTIKYACRKTLADSRIRIRGRFARNDEIEKEDRDEEEEEEYDENWTNFLQMFQF
ncbi:zinc finger protein CONSTANS-LIKE 14-like [Impatiens glandulifera]|uniref:zinc finger protein CONSTANS-LIKE 14-like n=1 Tax=Impatiens glandulifera TaxID=253017 RepID=UPI001FB0E15A|nr:zinc finger protein CONSTANS-LIKE 14-like [Impatiens glandulifera]